MNFLPATLITVLLVLISIKNTAQLIIEQRKKHIGIMLALGFTRLRIMYYFLNGFLKTALFAFCISVFLGYEVIDYTGERLNNFHGINITILSVMISFFVVIVSILSALFPFYSLFKRSVINLLD
jgi:ABC-type antimicrobial peptide transport system permease subunit